MDGSHILVGGMTAITIALLVWIEIRSRRNTGAQTEQESGSVALAEAQAPPKKRGR